MTSVLTDESPHVTFSARLQSVVQDQGPSVESRARLFAASGEIYAWPVHTNASPPHMPRRASVFVWMRF